MKIYPAHVFSKLDPAGIGGCYDHHGALSTTNTTKVPVCTGPGEVTLAVQNNHILSRVGIVWPKFTWNQGRRLTSAEQQFLVGAGVFVGAVKHLGEKDRNQLTVEAMSTEAVTTSEIEGEILDRANVQSSIQRQLGLAADNRRVAPAEHGISEMMVDLCKTFSAPVSDQTLFEWHRMFTRRAHYYEALEAANKQNEITAWLAWFAGLTIEAQRRTIAQIEFLIDKTKLLDRLSGQLNDRQQKALLRMFMEGPQGFKGGLSAGKYSTITGASPATTTRDLADLTQKGALVREGERRHARYKLGVP